MNKIKESAAWQKCRGEETYDAGYPVKASDNFIDGYMAGAADALRSQWVKVEDALPISNHDVLVAYTDYMTSVKCIGIANYDDIDGKWYSADDGIYSSRHSISHWMPIPPFPEAGEEGEE